MFILAYFWQDILLKKQAFFCLKKGAKVQLRRLQLVFYNFIGLFQKSKRNNNINPNYYEN